MEITYFNIYLLVYFINYNLSIFWSTAFVYGGDYTEFVKKKNKKRKEKKKDSNIA